MSGPIAPIPTGAAGARVAAAPSLAEAARQFEGLLFGTLLRVGTRPIAGETLLDGGSAGRMYREQLYEEVARIAAARGELGIGRMLEAQVGDGTGRGE